MINELLYRFFKWGFFKFKNKSEVAKVIEFENYKRRNNIENDNDFICRFDNDICIRCMDNFDKYGCQDLKGWK